LRSGARKPSQECEHADCHEHWPADVLATTADSIKNACTAHADRRRKKHDLHRFIRRPDTYPNCDSNDPEQQCHEMPDRSEEEPRQFAFQYAVTLRQQGAD
jgi:hypothetical protein